MTWEDQLLAIPTNQWVVDQAISFDWHDGPLQGWCSLANPPADLIFECVEELKNPNGLDLRTFRIKELPSGSVTKAIALLAPLLGSPRKPNWCPIWKFPSEQSRIDAEQVLHAVEYQARATNLLITTANMIRFEGCANAGSLMIASSSPSFSDLLPKEPNPS